MATELKSRVAILETKIENLERKVEDQAEQLGRYAEGAQKMALAKQGIVHNTQTNASSIDRLGEAIGEVVKTTAGIRRDRITLWTTVLIVVGGIITAIITKLL